MMLLHGMIQRLMTILLTSIVLILRSKVSHIQLDVHEYIPGLVFPFTNVVIESCC